MSDPNYHPLCAVFYRSRQLQPTIGLLGELRDAALKPTPVPIIQFDAAARLNFKRTEAVHPTIGADVASLVSAPGLDEEDGRLIG